MVCGPIANEMLITASHSSLKSTEKKVKQPVAMATTVIILE